MTLFNNNKTIVGLFSDSKDMEGAIANLQQQGLGADEDTLRVINEQNLRQQAPVMAASPGVASGQTHTATVPVSISNVIGDDGNETTVIQRTTHNLLTDAGLDDAEATFYAQHVARGSSVILLEIEEEKVDQGIKVLEQFHARPIAA